MKTPKFGNHERKRVISEVERHFKVKLHKAGNRDVYLKDEAGKTYWVIGGIGDYHGVPKELFAEEAKNIGGVLVIAKQKTTTIDIYSGSLYQLIKDKGLLTVTDCQYQFDICTKDEIMKLKQAPDVRLIKISTIEYTQEDKITDKTVHNVTNELNRLVRHLPEQERITLLRKMTQQEK